MKDGFLFIDKGVDWTSRDICNKVSHLINNKKVGHTGTLDPFATGLLIVTAGSGTKAGYYLDDMDKTYEATLKLGSKTNTGDYTGEVIENKEVKELTTQDVINALNKQLGEQDQLPPMTSAIKVNGVKLYTLAHKGIEIERKTRKIFIKDIKLINFENNIIKFSCTVSKGTYIRTLGEQIAEDLSTVGHLIALRRVAIGPYKINNAINVLDTNEEKIIPIYKVLKEYMRIYVANDYEENKVRNGASLDNKNNLPNENILIVDKNNNALAIYQIEGNKMICLRGLWS